METYDEIYRRMSEKYTAESGFEIHRGKRL